MARAAEQCKYALTDSDSKKFKMGRWFHARRDAMSVDTEITAGSRRTTCLAFYDVQGKLKSVSRGLDTEDEKTGAGKPIPEHYEAVVLTYHGWVGSFDWSKHLKTAFSDDPNTSGGSKTGKNKAGNTGLDIFPIDLRDFGLNLGVSLEPTIPTDPHYDLRVSSFPTNRIPWTALSSIATVSPMTRPRDNTRCTSNPQRSRRWSMGGWFPSDWR